MEIGIKIAARFQKLIDRSFLERTATTAIRETVNQDNIELGIMITGDRQIKQLNRQYRGIDNTTDVLSFAMEEQASNQAEGLPDFACPPDNLRHLGEVIISYPQAERQAAEYGHPVEREIAVLVIHGVLHLLGFDHEDDAEALEMERRESSILTKLAEFKL